MDSFLMLAGLGPLGAEKTTGGPELDGFSVKGGNRGRQQV